MAERWLGACSKQSCDVTHAFAEASDEALADMCIARWGLDQPQGDDNDISWFEAHEASRELLVWAFATFRVFALQEDPSRRAGGPTNSRPENGGARREA
jgi:hypothetical protein